MSTLTEIETAAAKLSPEEKQQLLLFLASSLRTDHTGVDLPPVRHFTPAQVQAWIDEDEQRIERAKQ